jgi:hypothetical protein
MSSLPRIRLQHFDLSDAQRAALDPLLTQVAAQLQVSLKLVSGWGEMLLIDAGTRTRMGSQMLAAVAECRPIVWLPQALGNVLDQGQSREQLQADLLRQIEDALARRLRQDPRPALAWSGLEPGSENDSEPNERWDSRLEGGSPPSRRTPEALQQTLKTLLGCVGGLQGPFLNLGFSDQAVMRFDFERNCVLIDPEAWEHLRASRQLPVPVRAEPGASAHVLPLPLVVWQLGLAAGSLELLSAPDDWWHRALFAGPTIAAVERYSLQPLHRELARWLFEAPQSPSQLRHRTRCNVSELRSFVQACLFLGLLRWDDRELQRAA